MSDVRKRQTLEYQMGYKDAKRVYEQRWIPCSERLPDQDGKYLVTVYCTKDISFVDTFDYMPISDGWVDHKTAVDWNGYVLAWMTLPKPYKEEGEVE